MSKQDLIALEGFGCLIIKMFFTYIFFELYIWTGMTVHYSLFIALLYFTFVLVVRYNTFGTCFFATATAAIFLWMFTASIHAFPHSDLFFWAYGYDKVFLFEL